MLKIKLINSGNLLTTLQDHKSGYLDCQLQHSPTFQRVSTTCRSCAGNHFKTSATRTMTLSVPSCVQGASIYGRRIVKSPDEIHSLNWPSFPTYIFFNNLFLQPFQKDIMFKVYQKTRSP